MKFKSLSSVKVYHCVVTVWQWNAIHGERRAEKTEEKKRGREQAEVILWSEEMYMVYGVQHVCTILSI